MTELFGRVVLTLALAAMLVATARAAFAGEAVVTPGEAIAQAVADRLGGDVVVDVTGLDTAVEPAAALHALPEPGARAGAPVRFVLMVGRERRGVAVATVTVEGAYARAARAIGRHEALDADAVEIARGELREVQFKRLPAPDAVVGLTARRDIARGEPLTQAVLEVPPAVRAGDVVALTVIAGAVEVTATATALGSGFEDETIRVRPRPSGRPVTARIVGPGAVEVVR